jgi:hypothetical protein
MGKGRNQKEARLPQSDETLRFAAKHVSYEIGMLIAAGMRVPHGFSSPADDDTANMALESFLLHFRNLRAFLCPSLQNTVSDDVIASDFLNAPREADLADPKVLGREKEKIDKLLAHISYSREGYVRSGAKTWPAPRMLEEMRAALRQFVTQLPTEKQEWFLDEARVRDAISGTENMAASETGYTSTSPNTDVVRFLGVGRKS